MTAATWVLLDTRYGEPFYGVPAGPYASAMAAWHVNMWDGCMAYDTVTGEVIVAGGTREATGVSVLPGA